jgi:hypothetical protein
LIARDVINIKRNPILVRARMGQAVFLAVFAGGVFFGVTDYYKAGIQATMSSNNPKAQSIL